MIIAIDGPAGSGKSTVAKAVAARLGFLYLDTGAMYRAVALRALERGLPLDDEEAVASIAVSEPITFERDPAQGPSSIVRRVLIGGMDVTAAIRTPAVDAAVSPVSALPSVRTAMVEQQRLIGEGADIVVEGRDIGSVVFPDAEVKVFLTASPEERARRRAVEQREAGIAVTDVEVLEAIARRDTYDSSREHSPLSVAEGAHVVDTTALTVPEIVERVAELARETGM